MLDKRRHVLKAVSEARAAVAGVEALSTGTLSVCAGLIECINPYTGIVGRRVDRYCL